MKKSTTKRAQPQPDSAGPFFQPQPDLKGKTWDTNNELFSPVIRPNLMVGAANNPATTAWGAIGCVEITGPGQWHEFNNRIRELSGNNDLTAIGASNQLTVTFESAERPPLSPETPSQSSPEPASTTPAR